VVAIKVKNAPAKIVNVNVIRKNVLKIATAAAMKEKNVLAKNVTAIAIANVKSPKNLLKISSEEIKSNATARNN